MKKRLLSLCLVGVLCFTLTGCGNTDFSTAEFNGETISLGESKEDVQDKFGEFYDKEYDDISNDKNGSVDLEISDDNKVMSISGFDDVTIGSITIGDTLEDTANALGIETKDIGNDTKKLFLFDEDDNMFRSLTTEIPDYYDRGGDGYFKDTRENFGYLNEIIECYPEINDTFKNSKYALVVDIEDGKVLSLSVIDVPSVLNGSGQGFFW